MLNFGFWVLLQLLYQPKDSHSATKRSLVAPSRVSVVMLCTTGVESSKKLRSVSILTPLYRPGPKPTPCRTICSASMPCHFVTSGLSLMHRFVIRNAVLGFGLDSQLPFSYVPLKIVPPPAARCIAYVIRILRAAYGCH